MPFEARKAMKWGPGINPIPLAAGDEIPPPVKKVLLQNRHAAYVDEIKGKTWAENVAERLKVDPSYADVLNADGTVPMPKTLHRTMLVQGSDDHEPADPRAPEAEALVASPPDAPLPLGDAGGPDLPPEPASPAVEPPKARRKITKKKTVRRSKRAAK